MKEEKLKHARKNGYNPYLVEKPITIITDAMESKRFEDEVELNKPAKTVVLLNCSIITGSEGFYRYTNIMDYKVKEIIENAENVISAIGHQSTATIISEILGIDVPVNRIDFKQKFGEVAIVFRMKRRAPEGVILTYEQILEIGYDWKMIERFPLSLV